MMKMYSEHMLVIQAVGGEGWYLVIRWELFITRWEMSKGCCGGFVFAPHQLICLICPELAALPQQRASLCSACSQIGFPCGDLFFL